MSEWVLPGIYVILGLMMWVLASMMKKGTLKRNSLAGIRLESVMASDEIWAYVHRNAAYRFVVLGLVCFDCAVLTALPVLFPDLMPLWVPLAIAVLQIAVGLAWIAYHAQRDAREFSRKDELSK